MAITISGSGITSANIADGTIVNADINSSAAIAGTKVSGSFGKVLQVVQGTKTDLFTTSSTSFVDITGLSKAITPSSTASKILVMVSFSFSVNAQGVAAHFNLQRGGSNISVGDTVSGRTSCTVGSSSSTGTSSVYGVTINYLDTPSSTSSQTYSVQMKMQNSTGYINARSDDAAADSAYCFRGVSTVTVMEIGA